MCFFSSLFFSWFVSPLGGECIGLFIGSFPDLSIILYWLVHVVVVDFCQELSYQPCSLFRRVEILLNPFQRNNPGGILWVVIIQIFQKNLLQELVEAKYFDLILQVGDWIVAIWITFDFVGVDVDGNDDDDDYDFDDAA